MKSRRRPCDDGDVRPRRQAYLPNILTKNIADSEDFTSTLLISPMMICGHTVARHALDK
jgi:hypothetical protein